MYTIDLVGIVLFTDTHQRLQIGMGFPGCCVGFYTVVKVLVQLNIKPP